MQASTPIRTETAVALRHDERDRPYLLQPAATPRAAGLVLQLHGRGIDARTFDRLTGMQARAAAAGLAVALPDALDNRWNDGRDWVDGREGPADVDYLAAVIEDACARLELDPARAHVVGMSNGAAMAGLLARERPARVASLVQVAATAWRATERARPDAPVPVLHVHGSDDPYWPYEGGVAPGWRRRILMREPRHDAMGVDEWARFWVEANAASPQPDPDAIGRSITIRTWCGPTPDADVTFYRVAGGGHTWPGSDLPPRTLFLLLWGITNREIDATKLALDFFAAHQPTP
jgi:polyhydroxybutyrate depolymerase